MRSVIRWAIQNTPAMNTLMVAILVVGVVGLLNLRRELFPEFDLDMITVTVPYPGATPEEIEEGICQKIEEAVRAVDGIKKRTAVASEGVGAMTLELVTGADAERVFNEVRSEIDRISSFPVLAEDPEVKQVTRWETAINVGVIGPQTERPEAERELRDLAEQVRDELVRLPDVSQAEVTGASDYEIDVEIPEQTLRSYGQTLQDVAEIIRRQNLELPGGLLRTDWQEILIRGKNKRLKGSEIAKIPLVTQPNGVVLTVGDLGTVRDEFADETSISRIDGKPGLAISVQRTSKEDLLAVSGAVHEYIASKQLPPGYRFVTWGDRSVDVRDRMNLLVKNGLWGLILVVIVLALFMEFRLAWWVSLGIPISLLGSCAVLLLTGQTLNMITMFAFLMALGIVVDDAIVIGENVYTHRQRGTGRLRAAIDGTVEVLPSVGASVATTVFAFMPLLFVSGVMGKIIAVMPLAIIAILLISLFEVTFILPCHLAHGREEGTAGGLIGGVRRTRGRMPPLLRYTLGSAVLGAAFILAHFLYPLHKLGELFGWLNRRVLAGLEAFIRWVYLPLLRAALGNPAVALSIAVVMLLSALALVRGGIVPFVVFPKVDSNTITASVSYPDGTPERVTDEATRRIEAAIRQLDKEYADQGTPILKLTRRSVGLLSVRTHAGMSSVSSGSHVGSVTAELVNTEHRSVPSDRIVAEWRAAAGQFAGAESVSFGSAFGGPGGTPIEFKLLAKREDTAALEAAVRECKAKLAEFPGVFDVADDNQPGKWEFQLRVKEDAVAMGVPLAHVAETVRASYYGEEVMRLQRGRHEVKLMVRYPRQDRRSLADFEQIRVRAIDGAERPLTELADVRVERGLSKINRVDQLRAVTISADVDESRANARQIVASLRRQFVPDLLRSHPEVSIRWEGQQEQMTESMQSLASGFAVALIAMFVLLTLEFRSYFQPLLILAIMPFGLVGAVAGHALMGMPLTLMSIFGLVALMGVVVNDSIVLVDFINHRVRDGVPLRDALCDAGRRRVRPILLTSVTTIAGLSFLLAETSFQAQMLIPMALSLCAGLALTTLLVPILVPTFYLAYARLTGQDVEVPSAAEPVIPEPHVSPTGAAARASW